MYLVYIINEIHSYLMCRKNDIDVSFRLCHREKFCPPKRKIKNSREVWTGIQNIEQTLKKDSMNSVEKVQTHPQIWAMENANDSWRETPFWGLLGNQSISWLYLLGNWSRIIIKLNGMSEYTLQRSEMYTIPGMKCYVLYG